MTERLWLSGNKAKVWQSFTCLAAGLRYRGFYQVPEESKITLLQG